MPTIHQWSQFFGEFMADIANFVIMIYFIEGCSMNCYGVFPKWVIRLSFQK